MFCSQQPFHRSQVKSHWDEHQFVKLALIENHDQFVNSIKLYHSMTYLLSVYFNYLS